MQIPCCPRFFQVFRDLLWLVGGLAALALPCRGQTLYDFGNPSAEEQLYLELINRARANPPAEGVRLAATTDPDILGAYAYHNVDLALMKKEFNKIVAAPPLAPNALLTGVARSHSLWMLNNATQAHDETNPSNTPFTRISGTGYSYTTAGENVYAYSNSVEFGHAGFEVDWGPGTGGMQTGRGHRVNIHSANYREIGVGVALGRNGGVGPQLVTQDFGVRSSSPTLATGVAYYDLNSNNFYDIGEGISGLTVNVNGASYYCNTASGGGWTIPVPSTAATRTVTFSGLNINQGVSLSVPASTNAKADLKLNYTPPAITSSATAYAGAPHTLAFPAAGGATAYKCNLSSFGPAAAENCENTANITKSTTGSYSVINTSVKKEGGASFHLENSNGASQWIQLNSLFLGNSSPSLSFQSSTRYATSTEHFKVQVQEEGSSAWQTVYDETGSGSAWSSAFSLRSAALAGMAGKSFRVRFLLDFPTGGGYYPYSGDDFGWFIDAITFSGVSTVQNLASQTLVATSWNFTPAVGTYRLSVTPVISGRDFPASYQTLTVSEALSPTFASWSADLETSHGLAAGSLADSNGDYDQDGRSNFIEYAFGGSPVIANDPAPRLPAARVTATHFVLQYQIDTSLADLSFTAQACSALGNWKAPGEAGAPADFIDAAVSTNGTIQTREARIPLASAGNCFLRVRVSRP